MRPSLSLLLLFFASHSLIGCVIDSSVISESSSDMSPAGGVNSGGSEVIIAGESAGTEVLSGDSAGETDGTSAGEDIIGGETAGKTAGESAGESAGETAGETAGDMAGEDQVIGTQCEDDPFPILPGGDCRLSRFSCGDEYECMIPQDEADPFECGCLD